jgi:hypothetical protein
MSTTYTTSTTTTFTVTHAKYIASKVSTDLKRIQRFYDSPSDTRILAFEAELTALLKADFLHTVTYGFKKDLNWIEPTIKYTSAELATTFYEDDDPGKIRPGKDVEGASFYSYLCYNSKWKSLTPEEQSKFESELPFQRGGANEPGVSGYYDSDLNYSAGGRGLSRSQVRNF